MNPEVYLEAFESTVDIRMDKIRQERQALKEKLIRDCENQLWLDGIDRIEKASSDLVAIRLYEPVPNKGVIQ